MRNRIKVLREHWEKQLRMKDKSVERHLKEWNKYLNELQSIEKKDQFIEYKIERVKFLIALHVEQIP